MVKTIGAYSIIEYPKSVSVIDDETAKITLKPDNDPSKAFDMTYAIADDMTEDLVANRPITNLVNTNIRDGVVVGGVTGTYGPSFVDMPQFNLTPGLKEELIPEGRYNGLVKAVASDTDLVDTNILEGVTIFGVAGAIPVADADVTGADNALEILIPEGYYDGSFKTIASDTHLVAGNIKTGVTIFGVASNMPAGTGTTYGANGDLSIGIAGGYYTGTETTVASDTSLVGGNILDGVTIFGVAGTIPIGAQVDGADGDIEFLIPEGYYDGTFKAVASDTSLIAGNIKTGETIFGVASTMPAGAGTTYGTDGELEVGIPEGYYDGTEITSVSDTFLVAGNIKPGITIFGVASNMPAGADIIDAQAVTPIAIPAGYYDGTETVKAS